MKDIYYWQTDEAYPRHGIVQSDTPLEAIAMVQLALNTSETVYVDLVGRSDEDVICFSWKGE